MRFAPNVSPRLCQVVRYLFILCTCGLYTAFTYASCTNNFRDGSQQSTPYMVPVTNGTLTVNPEAALGAVLATSTLHANASMDFTTVCTSPFVSIISSGYGAIDPTFQTFQSTVPGIGIRLTNTGHNKVLPEEFGFSGSTSAWNPVFQVQMELVKTGPITQIGALSGEVMNYLISAHNFKPVSYQFVPPVQIDVKHPTCAVDP